MVDNPTDKGPPTLTVIEGAGRKDACQHEGFGIVFFAEFASRLIRAIARRDDPEKMVLTYLTEFEQKADAALRGREHLVGEGLVTLYRMLERELDPEVDHLEREALRKGLLVIAEVIATDDASRGRLGRSLRDWRDAVRRMHLRR